MCLKTNIKPSPTHVQSFVVIAKQAFRSSNQGSRHLIEPAMNNIDLDIINRIHFFYTGGSNFHRHGNGTFDVLLIKLIIFYDLEIQLEIDSRGGGEGSMTLLYH